MAVTCFTVKHGHITTVPSTGQRSPPCNDARAAVKISWRVGLGINEEAVYESLKNTSTCLNPKTYQEVRLGAQCVWWRPATCSTTTPTRTWRRSCSSCTRCASRHAAT
eukprot:TRINITY_DN13661_c0_g3_i1.p2 TRINITY_DN13661_c0_g3~~TRINITY_DN13661_c0_g3_i1.p2  ORF type:complete len:108 (+),score=3.80 TRINITY_DN13661_c0_g3_i1:126-449(+)